MYCVACGKELPDTVKFCTNCGSKVVSATPRNDGPTLGQRRGQTSQDETQNYTAKRFSIPGSEAEVLQKKIITLLTSENYNTQIIMLDNSVLIQAGKKGGWRKFIGMKSASNIVIEPYDSSIIVKIGAGKWLDKAITGGVGLLLFWPLALTTGVGIYEQKQLPKKIFKLIETFQ